MADKNDKDKGSKGGKSGGGKSGGKGGKNGQVVEIGGWFKSKQKKSRFIYQKTSDDNDVLMRLYFLHLFFPVYFFDVIAPFHN